MKTLDERKATILAKAQADLVKAETECAVIESLPLIPDSVHIYPLYGSIGSARYNAQNKAHALQIFEAFKDTLPAYVCRSNNTVSIRAIDDESSNEVQECFAFVDIEKHDQSIRFFVSTPAGIVRVHISMGFNPFGQYRITDGHRTKYYKWSFSPIAKLGALLRVASYAPVSTYGDMSGGHYLYAAFERFEILEQLAD